LSRLLIAERMPGVLLKHIMYYGEIERCITEKLIAPFIVHESSLLCLQESAGVPCPESTESSPFSSCNIIFPSTPQSSQVVSFLHVFPPAFLFSILSEISSINLCTGNWQI